MKNILIMGIGRAGKKISKINKMKLLSLCISLIDLVLNIVL